MPQQTFIHEYKGPKVSLPKHYYQNKFLSREKMAVKNQDYDEKTMHKGPKVSLPKHYYENVSLSRENMELKDQAYDEKKLQRKKNNKSDLEKSNHGKKKVSVMEEICINPFIGILFSM